MSQQQRPNLLPEQNGPRDTRPSPRVRSKRRGYIWMLWLVVLLLSLTLATGLTVVLYRPELIGLATGSSLTGTAAGFQATGVALENTARALGVSAFEAENTLAALENRLTLIDQRETQSALDVRATNTVIAAENARQATQAALDFQGTQVAFNAQATRVELDYRGTQAALSRDATAAALGFATNAPAGQTDPTQTPAPTATGRPLIEDGFATGISGGLWRLGAPADWGLENTGIIEARRSGAWLLTQIDDLTDYRLEIDLGPVTGPQAAADYYVVINLPATAEGLALRLTYSGSRITAAGLYRFRVDQLLDDDGLLGEQLQPIQAVQVQAEPQTTLELVVTVTGTQFTATANGAQLLSLTLDAPLDPGAVGLQVPDDTDVRRIAVY
ncbi:MAG: hypothetical protein ACOCX3_01685 [Chloroflexota bacterium]